MQVTFRLDFSGSCMNAARPPVVSSRRYEMNTLVKAGPTST
jgi:hypothetical protein